MDIRTKPDPASQPDEDNPEWTLEDFRTARPALTAIRELFGPETAEALRKRDSSEAPSPARAGSDRRAPHNR